MPKISLLKSSYERLKKSTIPLLAGEICLVDRGTGYDSLVIGDGSTQAKDLPILSLGIEGGMSFLGEATPTTNPGILSIDAFYFAKTPGKYTDFGEIELGDGELALLFHKYGGWRKEVLTIIDQEVIEDSSNAVSGGAVSRALKTKISGIEIGGKIIKGEIVKIPVDEELSESSENPIMNKTVTTKFKEIDDWYSGD